MHSLIFSDREMRLMQMGGSFIAIDQDMVNIDDLISATPNRIVRCYGNPNECIKVVHYDDAPIGCVAGWVSEGE